MPGGWLSIAVDTATLPPSQRDIVGRSESVEAEDKHGLSPVFVKDEPRYVFVRSTVHFLIFRLSLTPSLPCLLYGYTGWPGRDGTEQEGTGPTQVAEATESTRAAAATREGPVHMLLFFVIVSLLSSFLHFSFLLF